MVGAVVNIDLGSQTNGPLLHQRGEPNGLEFAPQGHEWVEAGNATNMADT